MAKDAPNGNSSPRTFDRNIEEADAAMTKLEVRECPNISGILSGSESTCRTKFIIDHDLYERNLKQKSGKSMEKSEKFL